MAVSGLIFVGVLALILLVWLVILSDGMYFGAKGVRFVYDRAARIWSVDEKIGGHRSRINEQIAGYLAVALDAAPSGRVLDVATGTGRVPLIVASIASFEGEIVGIDFSRNMIARGRQIVRSRGLEDRITLEEADATALPFEDAAFDLVTCLQAPLPKPAAAHKEMVRVLKPDGTFLTDRRRGRWVFLLPGKARTRAGLRRELETLGLVTIDFHPTPWGDDLVIAKKPSVDSAHPRESSKVSEEVGT